MTMDDWGIALRVVLILGGVFIITQVGALVISLVVARVDGWTFRRKLRKEREEAGDGSG